MAAAKPLFRGSFFALSRALLTIAGLLSVAEAMKQAGLLPVFVPAPSQVFMEIVQSPLLVTGNLAPTAWKATAGYFAAVSVAVTAGALAILFREFYGAIYNFSLILNSIPIIATAPLLALWLGTGPRLQVVVAALACQFPILVGTIQGLQAAEAPQRELLHVLSASRMQTLRYLSIPSAMPYLFTGFKIGAPSAVLGAITAEWAGADSGVGAMMLYALFSYDTPKVWLSVLLTCLLAAGGYGIVVLVEKLVFPVNHEVERGQ